MSKKKDEINDNEIRIISASEPKTESHNMRFLRRYFPIIVVMLLIITGILFILMYQHKEEAQTLDIKEGLSEEQSIKVQEDSIADVGRFTLAHDTIINGNGLLILSPKNGRPRLVIGTEFINDPNIILAMQAADVRGDNGRIVGTFVLDGELIGKGDAKAGFCSIINGELSIGIADSTPMLEQALTDGGYFFRQYPLVVGGQVVENKPKGKAIRKALVEIGGRISVVISKERLTFNDFSRLLVDAGVRNAISLVGSSTHGFYVDENGEKFEIGTPPWIDVEYVNYIIWE